ncbi:acyl-CoA acyltransferase [Bradyrhizobium sp. AUGA SZCCT0042]|uniref:acyl-CoA acyltransferase n=1 Tax=Bradyrhizobium sp. AUGA SZCCT0042 TaxID=2807651 RepID=UPI00289B3B9A|nr:acyl-CoA acyltransferase [Bradyrhizobium sp. AUGA SZCCT0042]
MGIADLDAVARLLAHGFTRHPRDWWMAGLQRQSVRDVPEGYPRFGYMLDHDGTPVGILLLIYSARDDGGAISIRCNLSSWYVEPAYRNYAPMLTKVAQRHDHVTYVNISPADWTWPTIETQGFRPYCRGLFFSFPALSRPANGMRVEIVPRDAKAVESLAEADVAILTRHAAYGCLGLVCHAADGRGYPFVLQSMRLKERIVPPAMQLIYCHEVADYVACAGAIGRFLLRRGKVAIALDANGRMNDLVGFYRERRRKYFKGPQCPRLADLSDTELVIHGP